MEESDTFQAILEEGRVIQAIKILRSLAELRFGPASSAHILIIESETALDRLNRIVERILEAASWQDLLDTP